jgi:hypothetical protein
MFSIGLIALKSRPAHGHDADNRNTPQHSPVRNLRQRKRILRPAEGRSPDLTSG